MTKNEFLDQLVWHAVCTAQGIKTPSLHDLLTRAVAEPWFSELGDDEQYEVRALLEDARVRRATAIAARVAACDAARDLLVPVRRRAYRLIS